MLDHCPACGRNLCPHCAARFCSHCGAAVFNPIEAKLVQLRNACREKDIIVFQGTLGTSDAATITGIKRDTLKRWLAEGKYSHLRTKVGGRWRYELRALADFLVGDQKI